MEASRVIWITAVSCGGAFALFHQPAPTCRLRTWPLERQPWGSWIAVRRGLEVCTETLPREVRYFSGQCGQWPGREKGQHRGHSRECIEGGELLGHGRGGIRGPGVSRGELVWLRGLSACLGLNCVLINLEAQVTSLAAWALWHAKSRRQLRGKRKPSYYLPHWTGFQAKSNLRKYRGSQEPTLSRYLPLCVLPGGGGRRQLLAT